MIGKAALAQLRALRARVSEAEILEGGTLAMLVRGIGAHVDAIIAAHTPPPVDADREMEVLSALLQCADAGAALEKMTDEQIGSLLIEHAWPHFDMLSPLSDLVSEAADRLKGDVKCQPCADRGREAHPVKFEAFGGLPVLPSVDASGVPHCSDGECPQYDGKRCRAIGSRPSSICEPAVIDMAVWLRKTKKELYAVRAATKGVTAQCDLLMERNLSLVGQVALLEHDAEDAEEHREALATELRVIRAAEQDAIVNAAVHGHGAGQEAERKAIVAALRKLTAGWRREGSSGWAGVLDGAIDAIERGDLR